MQFNAQSPATDHPNEILATMATNQSSPKLIRIARVFASGENTNRLSWKTIQDVRESIVGEVGQLRKSVSGGHNVTAQSLIAGVIPVHQVSRSDKVGIHVDDG